MKRYLFIDNFRGFSNTCIPITEVNFLVGENSTGKTSVLGLLELLAGPQFFFSQEFGTENVSFGHFSDMVSANSADRSYFRIGLVWEDQKRKTKKAVAVGYLLTFVEEEGLPRLFKYTFCRGQEKISLRFGGGSSIFYATEKYSYTPTPEDMVKKILPEWIKQHSAKKDRYSKLLMPPELPSRIPLLVALSLVSGQSRLRGKKAPAQAPRHLQISAPDTFASQLCWVAPIRSKPRRTYDELTLEFSPEGAHTPYLIRRILHSRSDANKFKRFISKIGKASGLFQAVEIRSFGRGATAPFEVDVVLDGKALNLSTVGYGVSQSLPVFVELLARTPGSWFAIQQPEIHLHPRAQAALGDVIFEMAAEERKHFLIETHSDFTIDRFRMNYKEKRRGRPDSQILFFERRDKQNVVTPLGIAKNGELPRMQPEAYRQFFLREELRLLGI